MPETTSSEDIFGEFSGSRRRTALYSPVQTTNP
jgi:hypothetical protein